MPRLYHSYQETAILQYRPIVHLVHPCNSQTYRCNHLVCQILEVCPNAGPVWSMQGLGKLRKCMGNIKKSFFIFPLESASRDGLNRLNKFQPVKSESMQVWEHRMSPRWLEC